MHQKDYFYEKNRYNEHPKRKMKEPSNLNNQCLVWKFCLLQEFRFYNENKGFYQSQLYRISELKQLKSETKQKTLQLGLLVSRDGDKNALFIDIFCFNAVWCTVQLHILLKGLNFE